MGVILTLNESNHLTLPVPGAAFEIPEPGLVIVLKVKNDSGDFQLEVLLLSEMRGPAAVAQTLYRETEASRELRRKLAAERKESPNFEELREGRPSKRDRREKAVAHLVEAEENRQPRILRGSGDRHVHPEGLANGQVCG